MSRPLYWVPFRYMDVQGNVVAVPEVCWYKGVPYFSPKSIIQLLAIMPGDLKALLYRAPHIRLFRRVLMAHAYYGDVKKWVPTQMEAFHPIAVLVLADRANTTHTQKLLAPLGALVKDVLNGRLQKRYQPDEVVELLAFAPGRERMRAVQQLAQRLGVDRSTVYRRLRRFCLENGLPVSENPAKRKE